MESFCLAWFSGGYASSDLCKGGSVYLVEGQPELVRDIEVGRTNGVVQFVEDSRLSDDRPFRNLTFSMFLLLCIQVSSLAWDWFL